MKIGWLLQACIVVAVGVGLVSCTKEQIEQAMNRPSEIILSSRPCAPAELSTSTPEFCVNLTEIRLLNQDTAVDVSLTLVNRTDRRLQISLQGAYLTDSGGQMWAKSRSSGLGSTDNSSAASLDPNVENQGSILFYKHNAQASANQTFSLRGEIVIWRVDSRGQPIYKTPFAAQRAINISGIRIPPPPPQSSGSTEQSPDTTRAQVAPQGVAPTMPKASASSLSPPPVAVVGASASAASAPQTEKPEVLGIRLGMSPGEVIATLKKQSIPLQSGSPLESEISGLPNSRHIAEVHAYSKDLGVVQLVFTAPPNTTRLAYIMRNVIYDKSESVAPSESNLLKALSDKFGEPALRRQLTMGTYLLTWMWTADGNPSPASIHADCLPLLDRTWASSGINVYRQKIVDAGCGRILQVSYIASAGVVNQIGQVIIDLADLAVAGKVTDRAVSEEAKRQHAKDLDRANKKKPAL